MALDSDTLSAALWTGSGAMNGHLTTGQCLAAVRALLLLVGAHSVVSIETSNLGNPPQERLRTENQTATTPARRRANIVGTSSVGEALWIWFRCWESERASGGSEGYQRHTELVLWSRSPKVQNIG
eukprot:4216658-Amphidinium_carterae.1